MRGKAARQRRLFASEILRKKPAIERNLHAVRLFMPQRKQRREPKGEPFHKKRKGFPFFFYGYTLPPDTSGEFICGQVKWQGGLPLKERKKFAGL